MNHSGALPQGLDGRRWRRAIAPFAATFLVLVASFANFLSYHDYPFFRPEVALVALCFVLIAALIALAHAASGNLGKALLDGILVFLAVDLNSNYAIVAAIAASIAAFLRLGRGVSLLGPLSIIALVVLSTSATGLAQRRAGITTVAGERQQSGNDRPAILHLILDEHGGVDGATDPQFRRQLADFYVNRGFHLFARAYSRHFHTVNAIPDVLNFGHPGASKNVSETLDIGRTTYLSALEKEGYALHFYQSEFADFCRYSREATCTTTWSPSMSFLANQPMAVAEKAALLAFKFTSLSGLLLQLASSIDWITHQSWSKAMDIPLIAPKNRAVSNSLGGLATLQRMALDLREAQPGNVYFAHVLAPHYPYVTKQDCTVVAPSKWHYRRSSRPVQVREAAYREQVGCVIRRLDAIFDAFDRSSAGKSGIIIVHGDHGSRITGVEPADWNRGSIKPSDLIAGYATLFAVRAPGIARGIDRTPYSSPAILENLWGNQFSSLDGLAPGSGQIYLDGPNWTVGSRASIAEAWPAAN